MKVSYWGVRGSIPSPGAGTVRYGGDTSCVSVEIDDTILVLDAGTGIRHLGCSIATTEKEIYCLVSHLHLDHVRGFPFFDPLYQEGKVVTMIPYVKDGANWYPTSIMDGVHFPRSWKSLPSTIVHAEAPAGKYFESHRFQLKTFEVDHPGGAVGFFVSDGTSSFAHVPDNEIDKTSDSYERLKANLKGISVLSHDGQWTNKDSPGKEGWGHSSVSDLCDLAIELNIEKLIIFHHDPARTDDDLDEIGREASKRLLPNGILCEVAFEGMSLIF